MFGGSETVLLGLAVTSHDIVLSFISSLIGLAITLPVTYLVVERIVASNEKKKLAPLERMAKERLRSKLGVGFLTTLLLTLTVDISSAAAENRPIPKDTITVYVSKLKSAQSDLEMLLGLYTTVLTVGISHLTGSIILHLEHLQEDFQFLAETHPRPPSRNHALHFELTIHGAV